MNPTHQGIYPDVPHRPTLAYTLTPHVSMLPIGERFLLWALRQWQSEVAAWEAGRTLPAGGSALQHGFDVAGLRQGLPPFAMVMDAFLCSGTRPLEIYPSLAPIVGPDEGVFLALLGLAQGGLDEPLGACFSVLLSPQSCAAAILQLNLLASLMQGAGFGSTPCCCQSWLH